MNEFFKDLEYLIDQEKVDEYYEEKKKEVGTWIIEYTGSLKRIKEEQRQRLLAYAKAMTFINAGELNAYVQDLPTVSKKDKERLSQYLRKVDWLPKDQNMGVLEGVMVSRVLSDPLEEMLRENPKPKRGDNK